MDLSDSKLYAAWQSLLALGHTVLSSYVFTVILLLLSWRVWKFTVYPILHPNEPKEFPCWIPVLGHGFPFFHNSSRLLAKASQYFGNNRDPFTITAFGSTFCVITEPSHTTEVYKNTQSLSFEEFIVGLMKYLGLSRHTINAVFHTPLPADKAGFANPKGQPLGHFVRDMHHHQLFPGQNLDLLEEVMVNWFDNHLRLEGLKVLCAPYDTSINPKAVKVPLAKWCSELFTRAGEMAYFGRTLGEVEPNMATTFLEYDDLSWQVLYQYPRVFSSKMHAAMDRIQEIFLRYFEVPRDDRQGDAWFTKAIEEECRALDISNKDMARFMCTVYWVLTRMSVLAPTPAKWPFWLLYHLLHNPSLIPLIRDETASAFHGATITNLDYLHKRCPTLENAWFETLRLSSNSASARVVTEDTVIGSRLVRKGSKILIPYRLLHHNEAVFGAEVERFRPERFNGRAAALTKGPSWRPFGGGKTMCPGHFIAKRETVMFVAMVLQRFDIELDGDATVMELDLGKPVLGLADRKEGQDVSVRLTSRI
ncbi:cytochrome p450 [Apiospora hydei]|uniref:Cytochrome p450 n=1 Tax=Apiospora hydei TaxID=1337664 RepID=A0ABR1V5Z8_9PEZI